jgi:hypothetical protein
MRQGTDSGVMVPGGELGKGSPEARGRLLREFFLNACLLAMAKRVGFEAMVLDELARCDRGLVGEQEPLACGCGGGWAG